MPKKQSNPVSGGRVVVVGTGGTIAGAAQPTHGQGHLGYAAGTLKVQDLIAAVPLLGQQPLEALQLADLDSSDMDHATWVALHACLQTQLARPEVAGVVVTHGTDTLEETAYFLHRSLQMGLLAGVDMATDGGVGVGVGAGVQAGQATRWAAHKPVVLTAAMRPATAPSADGPQNLLDAVTVAGTKGASGVLVVLAGRVHAGSELRKLHGYRVDAFSSGDAGPLAVLEDGSLRCFRPWPETQPHPQAQALLAMSSWPAVEILTSHAGASGRLLEAAVAAGAQGIVIAGTGNGSVHHSLQAAAERATAAGVLVMRSSRCASGGVVGTSGPAQLPSYGPLTPPQARIELMLDLALPALSQRPGSPTRSAAPASALPASRSRR